MFFCCIIWSAVSTNFQSLLASRVVGAFAGSSTEALGAAIVNVRWSLSLFISFMLTPVSPYRMCSTFTREDRKWGYTSFSFTVAILLAPWPPVTSSKVTYSSLVRTGAIQAKIIAGPGWRWFSWLCAIIAGLNFLAIFLFVHETRFDRTAKDASSVHEAADSEEMSISPTIEQIQSTTGSDFPTGTKKTLLQNLSLWSGTS